MTCAIVRQSGWDPHNGGYWLEGTPARRALDWQLGPGFNLAARMAPRRFPDGAFGFAVPGKMPSAWLALGLAAGAGLGFLIPTADVEHIDFYGERRDCLVHMVGLGIIGAFVGAGISAHPPNAR